MQETDDSKQLVSVSGVFVPKDTARTIRHLAASQGLDALDILSGLALPGSRAMTTSLTAAGIEAARRAKAARVADRGRRTVEDDMACCLAYCDQCRPQRHFGRAKTPEGQAIVHLACGHSRPARSIGEQ